MNANTQPSNKIIDINNMSDSLNLLDLGIIPELEGSMEIVEPPEEIITDLSAASLFEEDDDRLFALKHAQVPNVIYSNKEEAAENHKIPRKRQKIYHEHPIPEPMDISESDSTEKWMYSCCAGCVLTDGQNPLEYCRRAYPDRVAARSDSDSEEEREIDEYDPRRIFKKTSIKEVKEVDDCGHDVPYGVCYDCIWFLDEKTNRLNPRRNRPQQIEEVAVRLFDEDLIIPVLDDEASVPIPIVMPVLQRQNTQFSVNGITVYNGNSNGDRLFDDELL